MKGGAVIKDELTDRKPPAGAATTGSK